MMEFHRKRREWGSMPVVGSSCREEVKWSLRLEFILRMSYHNHTSLQPTMAAYHGIMVCTGLTSSLSWYVQASPAAYHGIYRPPQGRVAYYGMYSPAAPGRGSLSWLWRWRAFSGCLRCTSQRCDPRTPAPASRWPTLTPGGERLSSWASDCTGPNANIYDNSNPNVNHTVHVDTGEITFICNYCSRAAYNFPDKCCLFHSDWCHWMVTAFTLCFSNLHGHYFHLTMKAWWLLIHEPFHIWANSFMQDNSRTVVAENWSIHLNPAVATAFRYMYFNQVHLYP